MRFCFKNNVLKYNLVSRRMSFFFHFIHTLFLFFFLCAFLYFVFKICSCNIFFAVACMFSYMYAGFHKKYTNCIISYDALKLAICMLCMEIWFSANRNLSLLGTIFFLNSYCQWSRNFKCPWVKLWYSDPVFDMTSEEGFNIYVLYAS